MCRAESKDLTAPHFVPDLEYLEFEYREAQAEESRELQSRELQLVFDPEFL